MIRDPLKVASRLELGQWPSPIMDASAVRDGLWIKNDGVCHPVYAGNKVRKLEFILPQSEQKIVTFGAAGSHHVLATAVHGQAHGYDVAAVLFPRPWSVHSQDVLHAATGLADLRFDEDRDRAARLYDELSRSRTPVPAGGSTPHGALGYVEAALELSRQIEAGLLPAPRRIYVPVGTAGTLAGLAVGLSIAGLASVVVGVRVVPEEWLTLKEVDALCRATADLLGAEVGEWSLDDGQLGDGYGYSTKAATESMERCSSLGLKLEDCYTAKALAAAIAAGGGPDLYWQTGNQASLAPLIAKAPPWQPSAWKWLDPAFHEGLVPKSMS
ncbi:MAG: 1-aminocyclopropane-1-carboxylate deaminase [Phycisphaerae bacterium]|nr:1-aminocyclopropane-1-carboxylate deaminase [Phycisphaerae bacterium]